MPKAHDLIPDSLGYTSDGYREERDSDGQLLIYFTIQPARYVVLGRYGAAKPDGSLYYVADWSKLKWGHTTSYHAELISAAAKIASIHDEWLTIGDLFP